MKQLNIQELELITKQLLYEYIKKLNSVINTLDKN